MSPPAAPKRSLRCLRCRARKFRTARDLALHILVKHGRLLVPSADDARSVTISSPALPTDVEELDALLAASAAASATDPKRKQSPAPRRPPSRHPRGVSKPTRQPARQPWSWTTSSSADSDRSREHVRFSHRPAAESTQAEGESVGPRACDVYVRRCRDGHVSLVPGGGETTQLLNFANGLF